MKNQAFSLFVAFAIAIASPTWAQDNFKKSKTFESKAEPGAEEYLRQAEQIQHKDPKAALQMVEQAIVKNYKNENPTIEARAYLLIATINYNEKLHELSFKNAEKAFSLFERQKNEQEKNKALALMAQNKFKLKQFQASVLHFEKYFATNLASVADQKSNSLMLAEAYLVLGKKEEALKLLKNKLNLNDKSADHSGINTQINNKIGEIYALDNNPMKAKDYYQRGESEAQKGNNPRAVLESKRKISSALNSEGNFDEELTVRKQSLSLTQEIKDTLVEAQENLALANLYLQKEKPQEAIPYLERNIKLSESSNDLETKTKTLKVLSDAYAKSDNVAKAMKIYKLYVSLSDSLLNQKERELSAKYAQALSLTESQKEIEILLKDLEINEKTINELKAEQQMRENQLSKQRLLIVFLALLTLVVSGSGYWVYRNSQKRKIANQLLALKSLRSQMNPHFIFNALNSINSFISQKDERAANKYLADFSKLMRMVMENSALDFVPLANEVNVIELYLKLEHFRFADKFDYSFEISESADLENIMVPPMLIQPYIENAVWHGLRYKSDKGFLKVSLTMPSPSTLHISIHDNGIGRKKSAELKTHNQKKNISIGMKNTMNRITIINDMYKTNITVTLKDLDPTQEETGTIVEVNIPIKP